MADPPPYPDSRGTGVGPDREPTTSAPRWVKVFGIIALVLVLLLAVLLLAGRGDHGPRRHMSGGAVGHTAPSSVTAHGVHQP